MSRPVVSPEGQRATFVELFFDLVFVFGITQLVALVHHEFTWVGAGKAVLAFWLLWWAWTQFTWALNAADTTHPFVELGTIVATAIAFFMSIAVPTAYEEGLGLWFAGPYVGVRVVGLILYAKVVSDHPEMRRAVSSFAALSAGGLATVLVGGYLGGSAQIALWGLTILLDFVAATAAGNNENWYLHAEHFAERHGLIVIIALGESLIVAAAALTEVADFGPTVIAVAVLSVSISCALWWTYFPVARPELEEALEALPPAERGTLARDVYSFAHFPMLCGVIAYAVGLEEALAHPFDPLPTEGRIAIALGLVMFVAGTAFAMWRATCGAPVRRVMLVVATGLVVYFASGQAPVVTLGVSMLGIGLIAALDERDKGRLRTG